MIIWFYILVSVIVCIGIAMLAMMLDRIKALETNLLTLVGNTRHLAHNLADTIEIVSGHVDAISDHSRALDALSERRHLEVVQ